jgi:hypothetical protein
MAARRASGSKPKTPTQRMTAAKKTKPISQLGTMQAGKRVQNTTMSQGARATQAKGHRSAGGKDSARRTAERKQSPKAHTRPVIARKQALKV